LSSPVPRAAKCAVIIRQLLCLVGELDVVNQTVGIWRFTRSKVNIGFAFVALVVGNLSVEECVERLESLLPVKDEALLDASFTFRVVVKEIGNWPRSKTDELFHNVYDVIGISRKGAEHARVFTVFFACSASLREDDGHEATVISTRASN
jgi:hypothetical protein